MKKSTKIILAAVLLVVLAAAMFFCWMALSPAPTEGEKLITVSVTHGDGSEKEFDIRTDAEYLWDAMAQEDLIDGTDSQYGKWVTSVDGETADEASGQYWMFTSNGAQVDSACDSTPIADGEHFEFFIYEYKG